MPRSRARSTDASRTRPCRPTASPPAHPTSSTRASSASRWSRTTRSTTSRESAARITTPASTRIRPRCWPRASIGRKHTWWWPTGEVCRQAWGVDTFRFWFGATDYKHNEIGLADAFDPGSDGVRQSFTNQEQEARAEVTLLPFNLRFAELTTAIGIQAGHQRLTAPSPDNPGLWDPNTNTREAAHIFNEFRFTPSTKAQIAGGIEHVA